MERHTMFLDWKNHYCQNDDTTQGNLWIQYNSYQITTDGVFHRTNTKNLKIFMQQTSGADWLNDTHWVQHTNILSPRGWPRDRETGLGVEVGGPPWGRWLGTALLRSFLGLCLFPSLSRSLPRSAWVFLLWLPSHHFSLFHACFLPSQVLVAEKVEFKTFLSVLS